MQIWFQEEDDQSLRYGYKVKDVLFRDRSEFQTVDVIESEAFGKMLLVDGLVMITDHDEFVYHEMIAHIPALLHRQPEQVLVIGGGDGGTIRELLKHHGIKNITLCEIDDLVIKAAKQFFPDVACGLTDPRVKVLVGDGIAFLKDTTRAGSYDLILIDSTDPIGPGEGLFTKDFYTSVATALKSDGIMACQSESPWYDSNILNGIANNLRSNFNCVKPYIAPIPTYPRGLWSWTLASQVKIDLDQIATARFDQIESQGLSYLTKDLLRACFALPRFYLDKLNRQ